MSGFMQIRAVFAGSEMARANALADDDISSVHGSVATR
jgi:hypothetical protein